MLFILPFLQYRSWPLSVGL